MLSEEQGTWQEMAPASNAVRLHSPPCDSFKGTFQQLLKSQAVVPGLEMEVWDFTFSQRTKK